MFTMTTGRLPWSLDASAERDARWKLQVIDQRLTPSCKLQEAPAASCQLSAV